MTLRLASTGLGASLNGYHCGLLLLSDLPQQNGKTETNLNPRVSAFHFNQQVVPAFDFVQEDFGHFLTLGVSE